MIGKNNIEEYPVIKFDKINVLNYRSNPADLKFILTIGMGPFETSAEDYYKEYFNSLYMYFYVTTESQLPVVSRGLNRANISNFTRLVEHSGFQNIKKMQNGITKIPLSELFAKKKEYTNSSYSDNNVCSFEVEVSYQNENFNKEQAAREDVSIFCFISTKPDSMSPSTRMNVIYEKLLSVNLSNNFYIPSTRTVYFVGEDGRGLYKGQPYDGEVVLASDGNPRVKMSNPRMAGPKLSQMQVSSKVYSQQDLEKIQKFDINIPGPELLTSAKAGTDPENIMATKLIGNHTAAMARKNSVVQNAAFACFREDSTFVTEDTQHTAHYRVYKSENKDILDTSYCGSLISFDLYRLLLSKSIFGPLIDFHRRSKNYSIIQGIVSMSKISNFSVYRRRVTDDMQATSRLGAKVRGEHPTKEEDELVIETSQSSTKSLRSRINSKASIQQVSVSSGASSNVSNNIISVMLKDHELFHNKDFGTYTYDIELTVEDGAIKFIQNLHSVLVESTLQFEKYAKELNISLYHRKAPISGEKRAIQSALDAYARVSNFFSGKPPRTSYLSKHLTSEYKDPSLVEGFLKTLRSTQLTLEKYMGSYVPLSLSTNQPTGNAQNKKSSALPGVIYVKEKTGIFHNVADLLSICADPIPSELEVGEVLPYSNLLQKMAKVDTGAFVDDPTKYSPNKFVEITKSRYKIKTNETANLTNRSRISSLSGTTKENFSIGEIMTVETREGYDSLPRDAKIQLDAKIGSYINSDSSAPMFRGKPNNFFEKHLSSNLSGITISAAKFSSTSLPISAEQALDDAISSAAPDIGDSVKKSIIESAHKAKDRKEFEKVLNNNYKELVSIRKTLGSAYDTFSSFLSFQGILTNSDNAIKYNKIYEAGDQVPAEEGKLIVSPFDSQGVEIYVIIPGKGKVPLSDYTPSRGLVFVKIENSKQKKIPLINNGILLRAEPNGEE